MMAENLAGETEVMQAKIREIDFMNSAVFVEKIADEKEEILKK